VRQARGGRALLARHEDGEPRAEELILELD
jgi:hypothetical protein